MTEEIRTEEYQGPDRRAVSPGHLADQHLSDAISSAITQLVHLTPKVEELSNSVVILSERNEENRKRIKMLGVAIALAALGLISTLVGLLLIVNTQGDVRSSQGEVQKLISFVEDCINPKGECFERNTQVARERNNALLEGLAGQHRTLECILLVDPVLRNDAVIERCRAESQ